MKITYSIILSLMIIFSNIDVFAVDNKSITVDEITYSYTVADEGISINKVRYAMSDTLYTPNISNRIKVPEQIENLNVVRIGESAFAERKFKKVILPNTVKYIGSSAFSSCENLEYVNIPYGVEMLNSECFSDCIKLSAIEIPETVTSIGEMCFSNCVSLKTINIPKGVTKIGLSAFSGCSLLESIKIPNSVKVIDSLAFAFCSSLENVEWNMNITEIGTDVFKQTKWIENYKKDFLLLNNDTLLYVYTGKDKEVIIPDTIKEVRENAFKETDITSVRIPASIGEISGNMFAECKNLTEVVIEEGVAGIGSYAFSGCISIKKIDLPESITYIKNSAFYGCNLLEEINIPEKVLVIGDLCFYGCTALKKVHLPAELESLGEKVFRGCKALTNINIPAKICSAIDETLIIGGNLQNVSIEGELTSELASALIESGWNGGDSIEYFIVDNILVKYNGNENIIMIPEGVTEIGDKACLMSEAKDVILPSTLRKIGMASFNGMKNLTSISIPGSVTNIAQLAFGDCTNLKYITFEPGSNILNLGISSFQSVAVTEETFNTEGRKHTKLETAFNDTIFDPDCDKYKEKMTSQPQQTPIPQEKEVIEVVSENDGLTILADEKEIEFTDAKPFIDENGRTQIPIRAVGEALGCNVDWNESERNVTLTKGDLVVTITIDSNKMTVDEKEIEMDTTAVIIDERTYIPLRFAGEALGFGVVWKEK